jgi:hypothetical protein
MVIARVRLSLLAGMPVATPDEFREEMSDEVSRGIFSRMLIAPPLEPGWKLAKSWTPYIEPVRQPSLPRMSDEIVQMVTDWQEAREEDGPSRNRAGENAIRIAFVTAAMNQDQEVTAECMQAALSFMSWQERVKMRFSFSQAKSPSALVTEAIILEAQQHVFSDGKPKYFNFARVAKSKRWYKWGNLVTQAKQSLVSDGVLIEEWVIDDDTKRSKRSSNYRLSDEYVDYRPAKQEEKSNAAA